MGADLETLPPIHADGRVGIDAVVRELLQATFGLKPDDIASCLSALVARHLGLEDVELLLVDLDQTELRKLGASPGSSGQSVDGTLAGLAFREEQPVVELDGERRRLWLPILDSAERVGVLAVVDDGSVPIDDWLVLTSLLGELIVSKEGYGDVISLTRRKGDVSLAAEMRWSLLPPLTFSSPQLCISGILQPSHVVAGDAFDYSIGPTETIVGIFDAMGHQLPAARLANVAVGGFRHARRHRRRPAEILEGIDEAITDQFPGYEFVTGQLLTLDLESGRARIHTAGHPAPVVLPMEGEPYEVDVEPGRPLGLGPSDYPESVVDLAPGDAILLLSDGVYEARSPDGAFYGRDRVTAMARTLLTAGVRPPEVLRLVIRDVIDFQGDHVRDDATLVIVRWEPSVVGVPAAPDAAHARTVEPNPR